MRLRETLPLPISARNEVVTTWGFLLPGNHQQVKRYSLKLHQRRFKMEFLHRNSD